MPSREALQDASALLYAAPFLICAVYGVALWVSAGVSAVLPSSAYLTVTRSPYVFLAGTLTVFLGVALDVDSTDEKKRPARLSSISGMLMSIAIASFILALILGLYSAGFNVTNGATDFMTGRYNLVFPAVLVVFSFVLSAQFNFEALFALRNLGLIAMALVPASLYVLGRHHLSVAIPVSFVLVVFSIVALLNPWKEKPSPPSG